MAGQAGNTDILTGINQVIVAINDKIMSSGGSCGCGPGGNPVINPGASEGQPTGGGGPGGNGLPPGYPGTLGEYSIYKCKAANYIFDDAYNALVFVGSMGTIAGGITAGSLFGTWLLGQLALAGFGTVGAGGVILFASVAAWEIGAIVALIAVVTLVAGSAVVTIFSAMASDFLAKKDDVVCELYNAQTVEDAQAELTDALAASALTFTISPPYTTWEAQIRAMVGDVIAYFAPTTTFNKLFEEDEAIDLYTAGTVDCTFCLSCPEVALTWGTWDPGTNQITGEWSPVHGRWNAVLYFNVSDFTPTYCGPAVTLDSLVEISGTPDGSEGYKIYNQAGTLIYTDPNAPPPAPLASVGRFTLISYASIFTVEVNWS